MSTMRQKRDVLLRLLNLERSYRPPILTRNQHWNFQSPLELATGCRLWANPNFFFVQIGAFDGRSNDPIFPLVRQFGIRGIVVEPQAAACEMLRNNYQDYPQVIIENAAIDAVDAHRNFYTRAGATSQLASFDRNHLLKNKVPAAEIVEQRVQCISLTSLLRKHQVGHLDLLQIDAEGADYQIIKSIDFSIVQPSLIRFEHEHLTAAECDECIAALHDLGYTFVTERRDLLAIRQQDVSTLRQSA